MPSGYIIGRTDLGVSLASHAEMVPIKSTRDNRKPDPAAGEQYAKDLLNETDASLSKSPNWQDGKPLTDRERWPRGSVYADRAATDRAAGAHPSGRANRPKTHCPQGHPYDQANTYWQGGHRKCRACLHTSREAAR